MLVSDREAAALFRDTDLETKLSRRRLTRIQHDLPVLVLLGLNISQDRLAGPGHPGLPADPDTAHPGSPRLGLVLRVGVLEAGEAGTAPVKKRKDQSVNV